MSPLSLYRAITRTDLCMMMPDVYIEDINHYHEMLALARTKILSQGTPLSPADWPEELGSRTGNAADSAVEEVKSVMQGLDPATRAFLEFEAGIKARKKKRTAAAA